LLLHLLNSISVCATAGNFSKTINHRLSCNQYRAVEQPINILCLAIPFFPGRKRNDSYSRRLNGKMTANNSSNRKTYRKNEHIVLPPAPYPACFGLKISFQLFYTTNKYGILLVVNSYLLINQQVILLVH